DIAQLGRIFAPDKIIDPVYVIGPTVPPGYTVLARYPYLSLRDGGRTEEILVSRRAAAQHTDDGRQTMDDTGKGRETVRQGSAPGKWREAVRQGSAPGKWRKAVRQGSAPGKWRPIPDLYSGGIIAGKCASQAIELREILSKEPNGATDSR